MENKLTKDKLDLLIEQVLNEKIKFDINNDKNSFLSTEYIGGTVKASGTEDLQTDKSVNVATKAIASFRKPADELTDEDFDYILNNIENPKIFNTDTMSSLAALKKATNNNEIKQKISDIFSKRDQLIQLKSKEKQSISTPRITSIGAEEGQYTGDISSILDTIFAAKTKIKGRVEKVSEISKLFYDAAGEKKVAIQKLQSLDSKTFLSYVMLMDYFVEVTKSFDSGSGAYLFEWFLAMLSGGKVTGKSTGPGGGMGAVDFIGAPGIGNGSAKYYATKSDIKQAASGFNKEELIQYIIGLKKQDIAQQGKTSRGTSDPSKMTLIDIYAPKVKRTGDKTFEMNKEKITVSDSKNAIVPIGDHLGDVIATIYIAEVQTKSFRDMVYKSVSNDLLSMKNELLKTFESFFDKLTEADVSCRKYSASGNLNHANQTIVAINQSKDQFEELIPKVNDKISFDKSADKAIEPTDITENKKSQTKSIKDLDKLIERVILESMNKK